MFPMKKQAVLLCAIVIYIVATNNPAEHSPFLIHNIWSCGVAAVHIMLTCGKHKPRRLLFHADAIMLAGQSLCAKLWPVETVGCQMQGFSPFLICL